MRHHATGRPVPVEQSIHWKPLHDPHYVVASLQPNDGGRRTIFVRQQVLARVEAPVRAHGRRAFGLLLGQCYSCPVTGAEYLVIESVAEQHPVGDETEMAAAIAEAFADRSIESGAQVLGWYRGVPTVEAKPSVSTASIHTSLFAQPWQTTLVVGEPAHGSSGAFVLHDRVNSRWFYAPFYELSDHAATPHQPKPTLVNWPEYITSDNVAPAGREHAPAPELGYFSAKKPHERPELARSPAKKDRLHLGRSFGIADVSLVASQSAPPAPTATPIRYSIEPAVVDPPRLTDSPATRPVHPGFADLPQTSPERAITTRADRSVEKLSIVDDRDQRTAAQPTGRRVSDDDDTTMGDDPARYIELARSEGFFIAARFDTVSESGRTETLWILNEPYSGMLLSVVTTDSEVVDASLHYNLQTDDAGLQRTPFPEHRDPESKTVYIRETCVDSLRARCRRLRATNALLHEWKVTPTISFLTPAEWESMDRGVDAISDVNDARIAELPPGVRSQFHLAVGNANA